MQFKRSAVIRGLCARNQQCDERNTGAEQTSTVLFIMSKQEFNCIAAHNSSWFVVNMEITRLYWDLTTSLKLCASMCCCICCGLRLEIQSVPKLPANKPAACVRLVIQAECF